MKVNRFIGIIVIIIIFVQILDVSYTYYIYQNIGRLFKEDFYSYLMTSLRNHLATDSILIIYILLKHFRKTILSNILNILLLSVIYIVNFRFNHLDTVIREISIDKFQFPEYTIATTTYLLSFILITALLIYQITFTCSLIFKQKSLFNQ